MSKVYPSIPDPQPTTDSLAESVRAMKMSVELLTAQRVGGAAAHAFYQETAPDALTVGDVWITPSTNVVRYWNGSQWTGVTVASGAPIQTVQIASSEYVWNDTKTYADSGLSATITPRSAGSKILVTVNQAYWLGGRRVSPNTTGATIGAYGGIKLVRNGIDILLPLADQYGDPYEIGIKGWVDFNVWLDRYDRFSIVYLDAPSTTSAITYKTMFRPSDGNAVSGFSEGMATQPWGDPPPYTNATSTITLTEIAG